MRIAKLLAGAGVQGSVSRSAARSCAGVPLSQINDSRASNSIMFQEFSKQFKGSMPSILNKVIKESLVFTVVEDRIRRVTSYNVGWGKNLRPWLIEYAYEMMERPENVTHKSTEQVCAVACALEMVNGLILMSDDMIDISETRRGRPCWYRVPDGGFLATNDVYMLHSLAYEVLKVYVQEEPSYADIIDVFDQICFCTCVGQQLDGSMSQENNDYANFTKDKYYPLVEYKTAYCSFQCPIHLAMLLANKADSESLQFLNDFCKDMGRFYQFQNDYHDCYGSRVTGKIGTDIQEGKCTWLAITALQRCNPTQRAEFTECYGSWDPAHVARIKRLYGELRVPQSYKELEKACYTNFTRQARALEGRSSLKPKIFLRLTDVVMNMYEKI